MDCQKLILYGVLLLAGIYVLKDVCGVKIPFIEGFDPNSESNGTVGEVNGVVPEVAAGLNGVGQPMSAEPPFEPPQMPPPVETAPPVPPQMEQKQQVYSSEPQGNEVHQPVEGIQTQPSSCYPQNTLQPTDLLPEGEAGEIQNFQDSSVTASEGILKGVNFLDAGFHVGVNTVGQSLRNANLNLRAEPPNPRIQVSPWMNSTIDIDLTRKPLSDDSACNTQPPGGGMPLP